jgi:dipeptidyl aminopeptidase/acylaminoacyl peptidase
MNKRIIIPLFILVLIPLVTYLVIKLARGYQPDFRDGKFKPTGLLVAVSEPKGAQVFINGRLTSATNTTISLSPGDYDIKIQKDGFISWEKPLKIQKELVTEANVVLFPSVPDLRPLTFSGARNPLLSPDGQKIVFVVTSASTKEKDGLYVLDLVFPPISFNKEARQIAQPKTGISFEDATLYWSPDSKQVLVELQNNQNFLLDADKLNSPSQIVDVSDTLTALFDAWQKEFTLRQEQRLKKLPELLQKIFSESVAGIEWSPDETKIMYTAQKNETIPTVKENPLPETSLVAQKRDIKANEVYVYDIKEDKNYYIMNNPEKSEPIDYPQTTPQNSKPEFLISAPKALAWFPTSAHLLFVQKDKITVLESDGTNPALVFANAFENGFAYCSPDGARLIVLTSLHQEETASPNLYALSLK